jgi:hypothetical protein
VRQLGCQLFCKGKSVIDMIGVVEPNRAESSVKISYPLRRVALPSADDLRRLLEIVSTHWPRLQRVDGAEFIVAFHRIALLGRREKLDMDRGISFWTDDCRVWQQQHQVAPNIFIGGAAFMTAAIAHGDVAFTSPADFPHVSFGLQFAGGGRPSSDQWREVLATGRLLDPTPSPHPVATKSPARVQQLQLTGFRG